MDRGDLVYTRAVPSITTHVLDTARGRPAEGVAVSLEFLDPTARTWHPVGHGLTDPDGRLRTLVPEGTAVQAGRYRITFAVGAYHEALGQEGFYPEVSVQFDLRDPGVHHHVPLLISPYGFSTYRGSLARLLLRAARSKVASMRIVYVMDPLERMHPLKDSTFAFLRASAALGHASYHCLPQQVTVRDGRAFAHVREAFVSDAPPHHRYGEPSVVALDEVDAVMIRKDPPFDTAYLMLSLCLEHARGKTLLVNDPRGLREANEKLYALHFSRWMPPTMVSTDRDEILAFAAEVGGRAVIKPLDGAGGVGVLTLTSGDRNARAIVDVVTGEGARLAMVQGFIEKVSEGDKRVILLDGEPLGAILRVPRGDDFRANIHVGGEVRPTELTERERTIVDDLAPRLRRDGLVFVGLDLVGGYLTEVNVTSPTGIQELGRFQKNRPEEQVIRWLEAHRIRS
jgi:glutathione synthase